MKLLKFTLIILSILAVSCNGQNKNSENSKEQYTFDYVGEELTKNQIDSLFKLEAEKYKYAINNSGTIEIVKLNDSINKYFEETNKETEKFIINNYKGVRLYSLPKEIFTELISFEDFKKYYLSLSKEDQKGVLSTVDYKYYNFVAKNKDVQKFLISEYNKQIKVKEGKKISLNKIKFFATYNIYLDSISLYLRNVEKNYYHFDNPKFLKKIYDNNREKEAFDLFVSLMKKTKENFHKTKDKNKFIPFLGSDYTRIYVDFLFDKSSRQKFKDVVIDMITSNSLPLNNIIENIQMLWRSNLLNGNEKKALINYSKDGVKGHYQYNQTNISQIQNCFNIILTDYYGFDYLKNYKNIGHYDNNYNLPFFAIKFLARYKKLNEYEKRFIIDFVNKNFDEEKIDWNYFCCKGNKERFIKRITDFRVQDNKKNYNTEEMISFLKSLDLFDEKSYKNFEREITKRAYNIYVERPLPLQKVIWAMLGDSIPEVGFDTEAGIIPLNYDEMLNPFIEIMKSKLKIDINIVQIVRNYDIKTDNYKNIKYDIYVKQKNKNQVFKVVLNDSGDWYSPSSLIKVLNMIILKNNLNYRWIPLETGDQGSSYILIELNKYKLLNEKYNIKNKYFYYLMY